MKKFLLTALVAVSLAGSAFAADVTRVSNEVIANFREHYKTETVSWTMTPEYAKATFTKDGQKVEVFYNNFNGEEIATSKTISLDKLPVDAKRKFAQKYAGYTVKEAIRLEGIDEKAYFISASNEKENVIIKVDDTDKVSVFEKSK